MTPGSPNVGIDVVGGAVENLKLDSGFELRHACRTLASEKPDPKRRQEVARALADVLDHEETFVLVAALEALAVWHSPESAPKVIEMTKHESSQVRGAAIEVLANVKTKQAIEAILDCFPRDRSDARKALRAIGTPAEDAILRRVDSKPYRDISEIYKLLGEIGSPKCVKKLKEVAEEPVSLETQNRVFGARRALMSWRLRQMEAAQPKSKSQNTAAP
jgi:HEAT repeat protein